ncbi:MAG: hypothetical protein ACXVHY_11070 [Methanobacterium sp.]
MVNDIIFSDEFQKSDVYKVWIDSVKAILDFGLRPTRELIEGWRKDYPSNEPKKPVSHDDPEYIALKKEWDELRMDILENSILLAEYLRTLEGKE